MPDLPGLVEGILSLEGSGTPVDSTQREEFATLATALQDATAALVKDLMLIQLLVKDPAVLMQPHPEPSDQPTPAGADPRAARALAAVEKVAGPTPAPEPRIQGGGASQPLRREGILDGLAWLMSSKTPLGPAEARRASELIKDIDHQMQLAVNALATLGSRVTAEQRKTMQASHRIVAPEYFAARSFAYWAMQLK